MTMSKEEAYALYRRYDSSYNTAQYNYTATQRSRGNAVVSRSTAENRLEQLADYRKMLKHRRDAIEKVIQDLNHSVSSAMGEANSMALKMAQSFSAAIFSGDHSLFSAPLDKIFRTKAMSEDEDTQNALRDCILERNLTDQLIRAYDDDIRRQQELIQDIQKQINQLTLNAASYHKAMFNNACNRDQYWKLYQRL